MDAALEAEEGMASSAVYPETAERRFELFVQRADRREQMGEPREPERPDRSMFTQREAERSWVEIARRRE